MVWGLDWGPDRQVLLCQVAVGGYERMAAVVEGLPALVGLLLGDEVLLHQQLSYVRLPCKTAGLDREGGREMSHDTTVVALATWPLGQWQLPCAANHLRLGDLGFVGVWRGVCLWY
jgi:hypothetical protein